MDEVVIKALMEALETKEAVALVTVTEKAGSSPRDKGSMMLVNRDGELIAGTIGGGAVEEQAKVDAEKCLKKGLSESFSYELTLGEGEKSLGMACGGAVEVFIKVFSVKKPLYIFGAGHIGQVLCQMAKMLGYHISVLDDRTEYAVKERLPEADEIITGEMNELIETLVIPKDSSLVIVTHGHSQDLNVLRAFVGSGAKYIGMIGSRNKVNYCFNTLREEGVSEDLLKAVHAPIGLKIGGETPAEIAISILAEMQAVHFNRESSFMKDVDSN